MTKQPAGMETSSGIGGVVGCGLLGAFEAEAAGALSADPKRSGDTGRREPRRLRRRCNHVIFRPFSMRHLASVAGSEPIFWAILSACAICLERWRSGRAHVLRRRIRVTAVSLPGCYHSTWRLFLNSSSGVQMIGGSYPSKRQAASIFGLMTVFAMWVQFHVSK